MFTGAFPKDFVPGSILLVGDDGKGTVADLAAITYAGIQISIVDCSPVIIERLRPKAERLGWSVFTGDITDPDRIADIVKSTSGGADAVFMKHGVHLNLPKDQKNIVAGLFGLCRNDGIVGWSVPTAVVGWLARPQERFVDKTVRHDFLHSTVYIGRNTPGRQLRVLQVSRGE